MITHCVCPASVQGRGIAYIPSDHTVRAAPVPGPYLCSGFKLGRVRGECVGATDSEKACARPVRLGGCGEPERGSESAPGRGGRADGR